MKKRMIKWLIKLLGLDKCPECGRGLTCSSVYCNRAQLDNELDRALKVESLKEKVNRKRKEARVPKLSKPKTPPRYDEVYFEGIKDLED